MTMALLQALRQAARQQVARPSATLGGLQQLRWLAAAPGNQLQLIKELRERTGAPMTDVKAALQAAGWDLGAVPPGEGAGCAAAAGIAELTDGRHASPAAAAACRRLRLASQAPPVLSATAPAPPPLIQSVLPHRLADAAVSELRKKGLAAASKKGSRHAAEGLVGLARGDGVAAVVEVRSIERGLALRRSASQQWWQAALQSRAAAAGAGPVSQR